mmetsp:Transcript_97035/g.250985  ORF Transcript_97035/g.250985 Transcript_97035/m.250985 type:complete len:293 (-) Transcript_97035:32-910(-)
MTTVEFRTPFSPQPVQTRVRGPPAAPLPVGMWLSSACLLSVRGPSKTIVSRKPTCALLRSGFSTWRGLRLRRRHERGEHGEEARLRLASWQRSAPRVTSCAISLRHDSFCSIGCCPRRLRSSSVPDLKWRARTELLRIASQVARLPRACAGSCTAAAGAFGAAAACPDRSRVVSSSMMMSRRPNRCSNVGATSARSASAANARSSRSVRLAKDMSASSLRFSPEAVDAAVLVSSASASEKKAEPANAELSHFWGGDGPRTGTMSRGDVGCSCSGSCSCSCCRCCCCTTCTCC